MATTEHALTRGAWTDLGTTPCFLQTTSTFPVTFVIDAAAPVSATARGHVLTNPGEQSANIGLVGQRVYARAFLSETASVVVSR